MVKDTHRVQAGDDVPGCGPSSPSCGVSVRQKIELNLYVEAFINWLITTFSGPVVCMQTGPETRIRCSSRSRLYWGQGLDPVDSLLRQVGDNRLVYSSFNFHRIF